MRTCLLSLRKLSLSIVTVQINCNCLIVPLLSIDTDRIDIGQDQFLICQIFL